MKEKRSIISVGIFLLLTLGITLSFSFQQAPAPVPPDIMIQSPDPSLPAEAKLLTGKWAGVWNSRYGWEYVLYVEKIDKDFAQVVQSWGEFNTSKMSCHCQPSWARVQKAKVIFSEGEASLDFITPNLQTRVFKKEKHVLSGEDEGWKGHHTKSRGHYDFSFSVNKDEPGIMKGRFLSGKSSVLTIEMKKIE